jgi:hypothetical protein
MQKVAFSRAEDEEEQHSDTENEAAVVVPGVLGAPEDAEHNGPGDLK